MSKMVKALAFVSLFAAYPAAAEPTPAPVAKHADHAAHQAHADEDHSCPKCVEHKGKHRVGALRAMGPMGVNSKMFEAIDLDRNGSISREEFETHRQKVHKARVAAVKKIRHGL